MDTARTDDVFATVRSSWDTARVERKLAKLTAEKQSILARIREVDEALAAEEEKKRSAPQGYGRRRGH